MIPTRRYTVTHAATDYHIEDCVEQCNVTLRENAVDTAQLILSDEYSDYYTNKTSSGDELKVYFGYTTNPPTTLVFDGYIDDLAPILTENGIRLAMNARSIGQSILMTVCGEEYGSESSHDDLDTLKEIITDATDGIVPNWVNKIPWSTDTTSGYSLGLSAAGTDYVAAITGTVKYFYFTYQPCKKALDDLMDYLQAVKGTNAGPHYIITPTNYLCVATVGNHEAGPATLWPTWFNTDQAGSTLTQGIDFNTYNLTTYPAEANYILYHGRFKKPVNEQYTEEGDASNNGADLWVLEDGGAAWSKEDDTDAGDYIEGASSVHFTITDEPLAKYAQVPSAAQSWNVSQWGGQYNKPYIHFHCKKANNISALTIQLASGAADYFEFDLNAVLTADTWRECLFPVGPYWSAEVDDQFTGWTNSGAAVWTDIDSIRFVANTPAGQNGDFWVDGLYFVGWLLRGARPAAAYTSTNPVKIKVVTDDVAKDDSGSATDDSGAMARLAYAEYLRASTTPSQGIIPLDKGNENIKAGQLCHIHAAKVKAGTYTIDANYRIQEHRISYGKGGLESTLVVTSDVINARPRPPHDAYNFLLQATNPDFQNRQISSLKARDVDITQSVLEKTY